MPFEKGKPKTGGRKKGGNNKDIKVLREKVIQILNKSIDRIIKDLDGLEPNARVNQLIKLLNFVTPKTTDVITYNNTENKLMTWNITAISPNESNKSDNTIDYIPPNESTDNELLSNESNDNDINDIEGNNNNIMDDENFN